MDKGDQLKFTNIYQIYTTKRIKLYFHLTIGLLFHSTATNVLIINLQVLIVVANSPLQKRKTRINMLETTYDLFKNHFIFV